MAKEDEALEDDVAEEDAPDGEEGEDGAEGAPKKKKFSGRTIILFIAAPALAAVIAIIVVLMLFVFNKKEPDAEQLAAEAEQELAELAEAEPVFYELPEMVVNLNNGDNARAVYLKIKVAIETRTENPGEILDPIMPRIIDRFQVYLREARVEDLQGSAGMLRLKHELVRRINLAAAPLVVDDVLFKEMIVQ